MLQASDVQLWIANPADFGESDWAEFDALLDSTERARSGQFRARADQQAYVLAHALRRLALAEELNVMPSRLLFSSEPGGRPLLISPFCSHLGFSHAHTREAVVFAVSRDGQLGVDIEAHQAGLGDFSLLAPFMTLPEGFDSLQPGGEQPRPGSLAQFFFYWTALEAFWKAVGTGLSPANPRVSFERTQDGLFRVASPDFAMPPVAPWVIPVAAPVGFSISLAVQSPDTRVFTRHITTRTLKGHGLSDQAHFLPRNARAGSPARAASV